ncbi:MAG: hypothetical protein QFE16_17605 [Pseudomonadota bacterium]|nr:hypothetical protein [Pseudomonadota bacterium]
MSCIETCELLRSGNWALRFASLGLAMLAGCAFEPTSTPVPVTPAHPTPAAAVDPRSADEKPAAGSAVAVVATGPVRLPAPGAVRSLSELRLQAARRIVAANPHLTYADRTPDALLAIPVLVVDLNGDGTIKGIDVMRYPRQAKDTTQIAIDAVRRAAPFGEVSRLPRPWRFTETFLFNDDRRFKPRTLDER